MTIVTFYGCSSPTNEREITPHNSTVSNNKLVTPKTTDLIGETENMGKDSLIKKWTWGDKMTKPLKSSISNAKFSSDFIFKTWIWSDDNENLPVLTFKKDSLSIHREKKYAYTINYDSLRIFTSYERPGDGFTRGIITKLTKDSLIIKWSTDDINKYVPLKNK